MCQLKFIQRQGGQQLHDFPHGIGKIWPHWMFSQEHFFSSARQLRLREKSMHSLLANWCVCFFLWKGSYQGRVFGKNETVGLVCIKDGKNERRVNVLVLNPTQTGLSRIWQDWGGPKCPHPLIFLKIMVWPPNLAWLLTMWYLIDLYEVYLMTSWWGQIVRH